MALNLVQHLSLLSLCLQNAALTICMRFSRLPHPKEGEGRQGNHLGQGGQGQMEGELYIISTAVFSGEVMKLIVSAIAASFADGFSLSRLLGQYCSLRNALIMWIPATLYSLQNVLQYVAATNLDASLCQVLYQMKLLTTALFSVLMLGRQLTRSQWLGILTCAVGVSIVLSSVHVRQKTTKMENQNLWFGFFAVSIACTTSGLAAVYIEKVFKTGEASLWVQNMHLSSWSILGVGGAMFFSDSKKIQQNGFFWKWDGIVCLVVLLQALGGMAVAVVSKYADSISKGFASALAIILTCFASFIFFDTQPSLHFVMGIACILISIHLYSRGLTSQAQNREGGYREVPTVPIQDVELSDACVIGRADASPETAKTVPAA